MLYRVLGGKKKIPILKILTFFFVFVIYFYIRPEEYISY